MALTLKQYVRKPFTVDAVRVTEENIHQIAEFVGEVRYLDDKNKKKPYIHVNRRLVPNVLRVWPGFWMTQMGEDNIRCYANRVFLEQFTQATVENLQAAELISDEDWSEDIDAIANGVDKTLPVGPFGRIAADG